MDEIQNIEQITGIIRALLELIGTPGWAYVEKMLDIKKQHIESEIFNVTKENRNEMVYSHRDLKCLELNLIKELLEFPQNEINKLQSFRPENENYDPYCDADDVN